MTERLRKFLPYLMVLGLFFSVNPVFSASTDASGDPVVLPEGLSPKAMGSLVSKLDAEQTDALVKLIALLDSAVAESTLAETEAPTPILDAMKGWTANFGDQIQSHVLSLPQMIVDVGHSIGGLFTGRGLGGSIMFLAQIVLALGIGFAAERGLGRLFSKPADAIRDEPTHTLLATLKMLSKRFALQTFGIVVFGIAALIATKFLFPDLDQRWVVNALIVNVIIFIRFSAAVLRFVLAPGRADLRLVSTDGTTAKYLFRQLVYVAGIIAVGVYLVDLMRRDEFETASTLGFWLGLFSVGWIMVTTWRARDGLTSIIIGGEEDLTPGLKTMATWWPKASIFALGSLWLLIRFISSTGSDAITPGNSILMIALIVVLPFLDTMVRGIAGHLVPPMQGEGPVAEKAHQETKGAYIRIGRVFLFTVLVFVIAHLLGLNLRNLAESGLGAELAANIIGFLVILAAGYLSLEVLNLVINARLAKEMPATEGAADDVGGAGKTRMATILPILKATLQVVIVLLTILLALAQLGVNITPLLAGAGVLGLAIGFGAQTLVKDVVSGLFFLLDDAFRMGEYVDVGGILGTVERISLRSLQLRDAKGPVHIVPYGSISKLSNMSRDWVIVKLKFMVPFDTDIEKVRKIFKKIGQQIMDIPEYANDLLAPFKSQGAADVTDVGIVIRGKFTAKPGGQWMVRREIYARVQKAFEENGIEFARKEVRVQMPEGEDPEQLSDAQKQAIAGAVSEAAEPASSKG